MHLLRVIISIVLLAFAIAHPVQLQSQNRTAYGLFFDYGLNYHTADFRAFPGVPSCCPSYSDGSGTGFFAGGIVVLPLVGDLSLSLRPGVAGYNGKMTRTESTVVSGGATGVFEHTVDASLMSLNLEPLLSYRLFGGFAVHVGGTVGYLFTTQYSQKEMIVDPPNGTFPGGSRSRNEVDDEAIPQASHLMAGVVGGVSYDLAMNSSKTVFISPELYYNLNFTNMVEGLEWKVNQLRIGIAVKWSPSAETIAPTKAPVAAEAPEVPEAPVVVVKEKPKSVMTLSLNATALSEGGMETSLSNLQIEEFSSTLMTPLLNYVFFDEMSSELPIRYNQLAKSQIDAFAEGDCNNEDRLIVYYQLLNIVGSRMRVNSGATLKLVGCNAGSADEQGDTALSRKRAESVKNYLSSVWGIEARRLSVEIRNTPEKAANAHTADGAQENRRVELISTDVRILSPLTTNSTLRTTTPAVIGFRCHALGEGPAVSWELRVLQEDSLVRQWIGIGQPPQDFYLNADSLSARFARSGKPIVAHMSVVDVDGERVSASDTVTLSVKTARQKRAEDLEDKEINRYSLILFGVRSASIEEQNKAILKVVKSGIKSESTVLITGYTDRLGDTEDNQRLAEERARATAKALGLDPQHIGVTGLGNATTFNPELPEGRLYTRTVDVIVSTPVAK